MSRQAGSGHGVQDPQPRRDQPHKVRYYLERRDAEFEQKMAEVLCVYRCRFWSLRISIIWTLKIPTRLVAYF
jgi:hypothetical protein